MAQGGGDPSRAAFVARARARSHAAEDGRLEQGRRLQLGGRGEDISYFKSNYCFDQGAFSYENALCK